MRAVTASVVVLLYHTTWDEWEEWRRTLQETTSDVEVIVWSNTEEPTADEQLIRADAEAKGFRFLVPEPRENHGFSVACNAAATVANGRVLVFVNDDCRFRQPGWLDRLVGALDSPADIAVAGPVLVDSQGQHYPRRPQWVCGACFAVRRHEWAAFGGFDPQFFFGGEETDYCLLHSKLGRIIDYVHTSEVEHIGGATVDGSQLGRDHVAAGVGKLRARWDDNPARVVASMLVGNERGRHLRRTLDWVTKRVDSVVVLDDCTDDGTWDDLCEYAEVDAGCPMRLHRAPRPLFVESESMARGLLHARTLRENPAWIMPLDADETLSCAFDAVRHELLAQPASWSFPIVHLWGEQRKRRVDSLWGRQHNVRLYSVRWSESQRFHPTELHCGSAPMYAYRTRKVRPDVALVHCGWQRPEDVERKMQRNSELDPGGKFEPQDHWRSEVQTVPFRDSCSVRDWTVGP